MICELEVSNISPMVMMRNPQGGWISCRCCSVVPTNKTDLSFTGMDRAAPIILIQPPWRHLITAWAKHQRHSQIQTQFYTENRHRSSMDSWTLTCFQSLHKCLSPYRLKTHQSATHQSKFQLTTSLTRSVVEADWCFAIQIKNTHHCNTMCW